MALLEGPFSMYVRRWGVAFAASMTYAGRYAIRVAMKLMMIDRSRLCKCKAQGEVRVSRAGACGLTLPAPPAPGKQCAGAGWGWRFFCVFCAKRVCVMGSYNLGSPPLHTARGTGARKAGEKGEKMPQASVGKNIQYNI
jgi:hypothetical protein